MQAKAVTCEPEEVTSQHGDTIAVNHEIDEKSPANNCAHCATSTRWGAQRCGSIIYSRAVIIIAAT